MKINLTPHQQDAFTAVKKFIENQNSRVFILKGYAGTGKTTLTKFLLDWLDETEIRKPVLLASTGRAAKVLENKAAYPAFTVHSHIYGFDVLGENKSENANETGQLTLNFSLKSSADRTEKIVYIVDEASMLSHLENAQNTLTKFGSGNLLSDLLDFIGEQKIIFIGDPVQLPPPVGNNPFSPALSLPFMQGKMQRNTEEFELTQIMRQKEGHSILGLATDLRKVVTSKQYENWEVMMNREGAYIYKHFGQARMLTQWLGRVGEKFDQAIILTHSNKQAFFLNMSVRKLLHKGEPPMHLKVGELLMVTQNSYYVPLANGDQVIVRSVKPAGRQAGFLFLEVEVEALHNNQIYKTLLLSEFLFKPEANLPPDKQRNLLIDFDRRAKQAGLKRNSQPYKDAMRNDKYLNALRAKFGYAVTCHKSQGGEWPNVFINLSETLDMLDPETRFRWLYTAVTRAQETLNLKPVYKGNKGKNFNRNQRR